MSFRTAFKFDGRVPVWLPGHMVKGMRIMQKQLKDIDCVIEVHDARIPVTRRNPDFKYSITGVRPHILVLNKVDLADVSNKIGIETALVKQGIDKILYTDIAGHNKLYDSEYGKILPAAFELMRKSDRYNRAEQNEFNVMVIGIPNVGKSTLINRFRQENMQRKGEVVRTGATAGVTKAVHKRIRVFHNPPIFVYDTPGILEPKLSGNEASLRLALISSMNDEAVGIELIADYALYFLNKTANFSYVQHFELKQATDNITEVLFQIAIKRFRLQNVRLGRELKPRPDIKAAAQLFVKQFREGAFGKIQLDYEAINRR